MRQGVSFVDTARQGLSFVYTATTYHNEFAYAYSSGFHSQFSMWSTARTTTCFRKGAMGLKPHSQSVETLQQINELLQQNDGGLVDK